MIMRALRIRAVSSLIRALLCGEMSGAGVQIYEPCIGGINDAHVVRMKIISNIKEILLK